MTTITQAKVGASDASVLSRPPRSLWADAWRRLVRNKMAIAGMVLIAVFVFVALFASSLAPHNPLQIYRGKSLLPAAWIDNAASGKAGDPAHIFGTDSIGRDVLSRVLYGARISMVVGLVPVTIIMAVGTAVGMVAGYAGGQVDNIIMRITDVFFAFPDLLFYIIVMITLRDTPFGKMAGGLVLLFGVLALVSWVGVARLVRGTVLSLKQMGFVESAKATGASDLRIMIRHILPNAVSPLVVWAAFAIPRMIIVEAVLGYLGIGLRPSADPNSYFIASWGSLMLEGQSAINNQPWLLLTPSICVALVVLSFTFLGDGLRDALDPHMNQ